jgi:transposase
MLTTDQINDLHRLYWSERWPIRKIQRHLRMGWRTIKKYLHAPAQGPAQRQRQSKLDPFKGTIAEWLEKDPTVTAAVMEQRLRPLGSGGRSSILREYVHTVRPQSKPSRAFLRMEPPPGERFEVDWGHFEVLEYAGDKRTLYAFALVEAHSRMLYLEFTHSQSFETFVRCHVHAFTARGGVAPEIAYDNLATAVAEHAGRLVRFLPRFLAFAREYGFYPKACNVAAGWEKGKVERAIGYARQSFWPLRQFSDLHDVNRQARPWLAEIANQRLHRETRERPLDRFQAAALRPLPVIPYDHRDTVEALVHKDLRLHFDGNRYCYLTATWAAASPSRRIPARSRSTIAFAKSSPILVAGVGLKPWEPIASKPNWPTCVPQPNDRGRSSASSRFSMATAPRPCGKRISATSPIPIALCRGNSPSCWN